MNTGIVAGIETGVDTSLVLTGSTRRSDLNRFPYRPARVLDSIADARSSSRSASAVGPPERALRHHDRQLLWTSQPWRKFG